MEHAGSDDGRSAPSVNLGRDRMQAILTDQRAVFDIADSAVASGSEPEYARHFTGYRAVYVYDHLIEFEANRSEEHTSELQSLMRISYAVFCLKNKIQSKYSTSHYNPTKNM